MAKCLFNFAVHLKSARPNICDRVQQHNCATQFGISIKYWHILTQRLSSSGLTDRTQHRKRLEMTQGVNSWQTGHHHTVHSCGFPLMCHNHFNHHHNPCQPGLLLLGCITLHLCHSTIFKWCFLFFLAK